MSEYLHKKTKATFMLFAIITMLFVFSFLVFTQEAFATHSTNPFDHITASQILNAAGVTDNPLVQAALNSNPNLSLADLLAIPSVIDLPSVQNLLSSVSLSSLTAIPAVQQAISDLNITSVPQLLQQVPSILQNGAVQTVLNSATSVSNLVQTVGTAVQGFTNAINSAIETAASIASIPGVTSLLSVQNLFSAVSGGGTGGTGGGNPCAITPISGIPGIKGGPPLSGGLYVPVKDFDAEFSLHTIKFNTFAIGVNTSIIQAHTDAAQKYLQLLCYKEYVEDPKLQHAWAQTIGAFTEWTVKFINTGYGGNPLYVSNPYIYYERVDADVLQNLYNEILEDTDIPNSLKEPLLRNLALSKTNLLFPDLIAPDITDAQIEKLIEDFTDGGGWKFWLEIVTDPTERVPNLLELMDTELSQRRIVARAIEAEKLAWGRGFFSLEECGLTVWSQGRSDRRNCQIFTPGSLIQEETALVLGSALRQMELADEYEEFISLGAFNAMNSVLNNTGLRSDTLVHSTEVVPPLSAGTPFPGGQPITNPPRVGTLKINIGESEPGTKLNIPSILQVSDEKGVYFFTSPNYTYSSPF